MSSFNSPIEAFAFDYVSFGIYDLVNNLLPLIAVLTAAVSFWRYKTVAGIIPAEKLAVDDTNFSQPPPPPSCVEEEEEEEVEKYAICSSPPTSAAVVAADGCDGVTRGRKFVMYFEDDVDDEVDKMAAKVEEEWSEVSGGGRIEEGWWERVLRLRTGDMGWYRCQDMTVINGNVVRLWEESCRTSSEFMY